MTVNLIKLNVQLKEKCLELENNGICLDMNCNKVHALCKCMAQDEYISENCKFIHNRSIRLPKCIDFENGNCKRDILCKNSHEICHLFTSGKCNKGASCTNIHLKPQHQSNNSKHKNKNARSKNKNSRDRNKKSKNTVKLENIDYSHDDTEFNNQNNQNSIIQQLSLNNNSIQLHSSNDSSKNLKLRDYYLFNSYPPNKLQNFNLNEYLKENLEIINNKFEKKIEKLNQQTKNIFKFSIHKKDKFEQLNAIDSKLKLLMKQKETFDKSILSLNNIEPSNKKMHIIKAAYDREFRRVNNLLPIYAYRYDILEKLKKNNILVLVGATGSGKSTQLIQYLLEAGLHGKKKIACTQPRKVALLSLKDRILEELNCSHSSLITSKFGKVKHFNFKQNKAVLMTDRMLLNEFRKDKKLKNYSIVILDEAHERSLFTDLLLCELKNLVELRKNNNPLKVIITSATIEKSKFTKYFNCDFINFPGQIFPVKVYYDSSDLNYEKQAINKVKFIIEKRNSKIKNNKNNIKKYGDILVFLTSPDEIDRSVKIIKKYLFNKNLMKSYEILPLYSKIDFTEQKKIFSKINKTKIIFSTNIAETSLTIDGVTDVIDSGRVKERIFDQNRNISILKVNFISQSSATQRKGRAGRTKPGKCYRLYEESDYNIMNINPEPEIFKIHLGIVILQLLIFGVKDVLNYNLIDKPTRNNLTMAMNKLESLELIQGQSITEKGKIASELYVEPSIARMIIEGIKNNVVKEILFIASLITVSNILFKRAGNETEKNNIRISQVVYAQNEGDLISMLKIFKEFIKIKNYNKQKNWCKNENRNLNFNAFILATQTYKELKYSLKDFISHDNQVQLSEELKTQLIVHSICAGMHNNLAYYNGKLKDGTKVYMLVEMNQEACVHPSSVVSLLTKEESDCEFVLFNELMRTDRLYMKNLTPVNINMIEQFTKYNLKLLKESVKQELIFKTTPSIVKSIKTRGDLIDEIEYKINSLIDLNEDSIIIEAPLNNKENISKIIQEYLDREQNRLDFELVEFKPSQSINTRVIFKSGLEVHEILFGDEFLRLNFKISSSINEEQMKSLFKNYGKILDLRINNSSSSKINGYVIYNSYKNALSAYKKLNDFIFEDSILELYPSTTIENNNKFDQHILKAVWFTKKSIGKAIITFESNAQKIINALSFNTFGLGSKISVKFDIKNGIRDQNSIVITELDPNIDHIQLKNILSPLGDVHSVTVLRENNSIYEDQILYSTMLKSLFSNYKIDDIIIFPNNKGQENSFNIAFIKFIDKFQALEAIKNLDGKTGIFGTGYFYLGAKYQDTINFPTSCLDLDEFTNKITKSISIASIKLNSKVSMKKVENAGNMSVINIKSKNEANLNTVRQLFDFLIPVSTQLKTQQLKIIKNKKNKFMKDYQVFISIDNRTKLLKIYGNNKNQALQNILNHVKLEIKNKCSVTVSSLKAIISKNGEIFQNLKKMFEDCEIMIDIKKKMITLHAVSNNQIKKFKEEIKKLEKNHQNNDLSDACECLICKCPIDESYTLSSCGHIYCRSCLQFQIQNIGTKVQCWICNKKISIQDIKLLSQANKFSNLCEISMANYLANHIEDYRYCPKCQQLERIEGMKLACRICNLNFCTKCDRDYHPNIPNCDDNLYDQYIKKNTKPCPKCKVPIEKSEGCNHLTCNCGCHFCWICGYSANDSSSIYNHQSNCPNIN